MFIDDLGVFKIWWCYVFKFILYKDLKVKICFVGGFLRISGVGFGIEECFYYVDISLFCLVWWKMYFFLYL